jgi:hypothetical protein
MASGTAPKPEDQGKPPVQAGAAEAPATPTQTDKANPETMAGKTTEHAPRRLPLDLTPKYLKPTMGEHPVSEPAIYRSLYILDTVDEYLNPSKAVQPPGGQPGAEQAKEKQLKELTVAIDPFDDSELVDEKSRRPAVGVLLVHSQGWYQSGLALGNLMQSVCMAPGEVTRVAVVDWRRQESGVSSSTSEQAEAVSSDISQQRAVNEVQRAVATEAQAGGSSSFAAAATVQAGASFSGLLASANVAASSSAATALTAQFSAGRRELGVNSTNSISQRTAEKSQSLRSRRQSVVKEVSQKESEQMSSRILANYNRRHALNIEYFEVLQKYSIETELIDWDRCLFVPLIPIDFSKPEVVKKHGADLFTIVKQLGSGELGTRLLEYLGEVKQAEAQRKAELEKLRADLELLLVNTVLLLASFSSTRPFGVAHGNEVFLNQQTGQYVESRKKLAALVELPAWEQVKDWDVDGAPWLNKKLQDAISRKREAYENKLAAYTLPVNEVLNSNRLVLSQMMWLQMDSYRIYRMLEPYKINGKSLTSMVDPHPVGIFGNYIAFRWGFGRDAAGKTERKDFEKRYIREADDKYNKAESIALPTSGVFAEAVLGEAVAAEEIDVARYGRWVDNQPPLLPPDISALASRDRAKDVGLSTPEFAAALAALRSTPVADASHVGPILGQVGKGDMFRNMSGLDQALQLAGKLADISERGASRAGDRAAELQEKMLDTFIQVLESGVGEAAVAEMMLPGSGAMVLQERAKHPKPATTPATAAKKPTPTGGGTPAPPTGGAPSPATPPVVVDAVPVAPTPAAGAPKGPPAGAAEYK